MGEWAQGPGIRRLEELVQRQAELVGRLDGLSRAQRDLVAEGHADRLLGVLGERSSVIAELAGLAPMLEGCQRELEGAAADELAARDMLLRLRAAASTLEAVMGRDAEDRVELERRRDELAEQLSGVRTGRAALNAYASSGRVRSAALQDRSG